MRREDGSAQAPDACDPPERPSPENRAPRKRVMAGGGLYLVLTSPRIPHEELVAAAVDRAVPAIQLREKNLSDHDLTALAARLADLTRGSETLFIVNDRPDVAVAAGADGAHVGRSDIGPEEARRVLGPDRIVGVTGNTIPEALAARTAGADYLGAGPVFPTNTKVDAREPVGLERIRDLAGSVTGFPVVAIGGIDRDSAASVLAAGARYVAVVSAVCRAADPVAAMDDLMTVIGGRARGE